MIIVQPVQQYVAVQEAALLDAAAVTAAEPTSDFFDPCSSTTPQPTSVPLPTITPTPTTTPLQPTTTALQPSTTNKRKAHQNKYVCF